MISHRENTALEIPLNQPTQASGDEVQMSEPGPPLSIPELRAVEALAVEQLAQTQAMLEQTEFSYGQSLLEAEKAEHRIAQLLSTYEQKRKDREAAERRLAEVALSTEQSLKKLAEFENRLTEFKAAEEFSARSRSMVETRVMEIREEIKRLNAELAQCEERAAKERLAEEHASGERAAAEQRLEKERLAVQPYIEEHEQAQDFLREDGEAEEAAILAYNEAQESLATVLDALRQAEEQRHIEGATVAQLKMQVSRATWERTKAEKHAEEIAAAQARAEVEQQLTELRAAEERAAQKRAAVEHKLVELRMIQERVAQESAAIEASRQADELPLPTPSNHISIAQAPVSEPEANEEHHLHEVEDNLNASDDVEEPGEPSVSSISIRKPTISTTIGAGFTMPGRQIPPPPMQPELSELAHADVEGEEETDTPDDLAEALRRAAEEQRAAARELQTQQNPQRGPMLGVFGRKKSAAPPENPEDPPLSIAERIARDFGTLYDDG